MYTIIGGDGKEYGPATGEQIREWIASGRANLDTQAKLEGTAEWKALGDFPEFSGGDPMPAPGQDPALADRLTRLGAALADTAFAIVFALPGVMIMGFETVMKLLRREAPDEVASSPGIDVLAVGMLVVLAIQVWLLTTRGQTVGKRLFKIKIVRYRDGSPPGFVHAVLLRSWLPGLISLVPRFGQFFPLINVLFIFGRQRRCIHDYIADTKVVNA